MRLILYTIQYFFLVLDVIVLLYLLRDIIIRFPFGNKIVSFLAVLMTPIWYPVQYLLRNSILYTVRLDLGSYILLLVLTYLQELCSYIMNIL